MKNFTLILLFFCICSNSQETQLERVSSQACVCIAKIKTDTKEKKRFKQIKDCITQANTTIQLMDGLGLSKVLDSVQNNITEIDSVVVEGDRNIVIDVEKDYAEIEEYLLRDCDAMKTLMASQDRQRRNSVSNKKRAREHYDQGQMFFSEGKYAIAIEHYKNAVREDAKFAFAWDMIGYSYRKLEEFSKAIEYYNKSLEIDPKGKMPLINIAYAYEYNEEYDNAIEAMNNYIAVYPKEAEGFYGRGRLYHLKKDYALALDDMMKAYLIYTETESPYARDAEQNIATFYNELKEMENLEIFEKVAKKYNIKITD